MRFVLEAILRDNSDKLVCLLTGRCQTARELLGIYARSDLDCNLVAIQPEHGEWYPLPNGANDQNSAVLGIKDSLPGLHKIIKRVISEVRVEKKNTSLVGFSAGGVMALELNAHNKKPFRSIVVHAGAILRTDKFPTSKNNTPILLIHNRDDDCFEWEERFIPMCECLTKKGYKFAIETEYEGKHSISRKDIEVATKFINSDILPFSSPS
jgi:predicted esterase